MNSELIRRYNVRVGTEDTCFHLGDFAFGPRAFQQGILKQLNGRKILVRGNHDGSTTRMKDIGFAEVYDSLFFESKLGRVLLRHKPLDDGYSGLGEQFQFVGHIHEKWARRTIGGIEQINVGVDVRDFEPKTMEELIT